MDLAFLSLVHTEILAVDFSDSKLDDLPARPCLTQMTQMIELQQTIDRLQAEVQTCRKTQASLQHLAEVGEFAAMIVHEVRNPLTTVLMVLEVFQKMPLTEPVQERLLLALEEAERLKHLLNEILLFAKAQTLHCYELEVNQLLTAMRDSIRSLPASQNRIIKFVLAPADVWILGDRCQLKQVFINLIQNACEAVEPGAVITCSIEVEPMVDLVNIRIHNPGTPIPAEILALMETPFFTTKPTGNGLGLAIAKRLVEAHQGQLMITSTLEVGTTLTVQLPTHSTRRVS